MKKIEAMATALVGIRSTSALDYREHYAGQCLVCRITFVVLVIVGISVALPFFMVGSILKIVYRSALGWLIAVGLLFELNFGEED